MSEEVERAHSEALAFLFFAHAGVRLAELSGSDPEPHQAALAAALARIEALEEAEPRPPSAMAALVDRVATMRNALEAQEALVALHRDDPARAELLHGVLIAPEELVRLGDSLVTGRDAFEYALSEVGLDGD